MSGSVHLQMVNNVYFILFFFEHFFLQKSKSFDWSDSISLII